MRGNKPLKGIGRKLLTSILWVACIPMALTLTIGYAAVIKVQGNVVAQTLSTVAAKTVEGSQ